MQCCGHDIVTYNICSEVTYTTLYLFLDLRIVTRQCALLYTCTYHHSFWHYIILQAHNYRHSTLAKNHAIVSI